jgi:hypothetical protein
VATTALRQLPRDSGRAGPAGRRDDHNTDISDTWEREGENKEYFDRFSPDGYAVGVNIRSTR